MTKKLRNIEFDESRPDNSEKINTPPLYSSTSLMNRNFSLKNSTNCIFSQ